MGLRYGETLAGPRGLIAGSVLRAGLIYLKIAELLRGVKSRQQASAMQIKLDRGVFLFLLVFGKQPQDYLSVRLLGHALQKATVAAQRFGVRQMIRTCGETP
jgi:hypothetical protein